MAKFLGTVILITGVALAGFAVLLVYADLVRDVASQPVQHMMVGLCGVTGLFLAAVGARLLSRRPTAYDRILLSATAWQWIAGVYFLLAAGLLLRGRFFLALLSAIFGGLCLGASRAIAVIKARHLGR